MIIFFGDRIKFWVYEYVKKMLFKNYNMDEFRDWVVKNKVFFIVEENYVDVFNGV